MHVDHIVERRSPRRFLPYILSERVTHDYLSFVSEEIFQQLKFSCREFNVPTAARHLAPYEVYVEIRERKAQRLSLLAAAEQGSNSSKQFAERKRFDQVVVRSGVQPSHAILNAGPRR